MTDEEMKDLDIWLAEHVMGWQQDYVEWGKSWRYNDSEVDKVAPHRNPIWTGYWVNATRVNPDLIGEGTLIYRAAGDRLQWAYSLGREWAPTRNINDFQRILGKFTEAGIEWTIDMTSKEGELNILAFWCKVIKEIWEEYEDSRHL